MEIFIPLWVIMAIISAMVAASKGRNFILFLLYGLLIWPIALTHAIILRRDTESRDVLGVINGTPYWQNSRGRYCAMVIGTECEFRSLDMLEAALGGRSHDGKAKPARRLEPWTPMPQPDGRVQVYNGDIVQIFPNMASATAYIAEAQPKR